MFKYKNRHKDLYVNASVINEQTFDEINESIPSGYAVIKNENDYTLFKNGTKERDFNEGDYVVIHGNVVTIMPEYVFSNLFI